MTDRGDRSCTVTNGVNVTLFCQQSSIVESNFSHCVNIDAMLC